MTTIAASRSCMAADQRVTDGNRRFRGKKIRRIGDAVVGCAGDSASIAKFMRWLEDGAQDDPPKFAKDAELEAIVLTPAGIFAYGSDCIAEEVLDPFYAVGTGAEAALGAMHMGADPQRAVEVAALVDNSTGGPIDVIALYG